jgi:hypothetical protein
MAQATNSFSTFASTRNRELILDNIYNVSVKDTPILSLLSRESIDAVNPRWPVDAFAAGVANRVEQGDIPTIAASSATTMYQNQTQILLKTFSVTRTQQKARKAGRTDEIAYQMSKRSVELKNDLEFALMQNTTSIAASAGVAPQMRGFLGWVDTNTSFGAAGVDPNPLTNTAPTDGTLRTFTEPLLRTVAQTMHDNGAKIDDTYVAIPSTLRGAFDGFLAGQTRFDKAEDKTLTATLEVYIGPFGRFRVINGRNMRQREVFIINPEYASLGVFDGIKAKRLADRGDAEEYMMNTEVTLLCKNERAHGTIRDLQP